jgi:hypothetical protein
MKAHVVNIQLRVEAHDDISADVLRRELQAQLSVIQEKAPYRRTDGASWWTNSDRAASIGSIQTVDLFAQRIGSDPCPDCGGVGSAHANACDPD